MITLPHIHCLACLIFYSRFSATGSLRLCYVLCYNVLSCLVVSSSLQPRALQPTRLFCPWGFSRQEYWSGLSCPPPGDLPNPEIEPRSPALQVILYCLSHQGRPRILEWVAHPFSRGSSQSRNCTRVSHTASGFFTLPAKLPRKPHITLIGV